MKAAVVSAFDAPPRYQDFPDPTATGPDELVVDVLAAGLHPRVRSQANGSHYTTTGELPLVPGVDGVGRGPGGRLRYFVLPETTLGSMAERTVIDVRRSVVLPEGSDVLAVAAAMNPAMSSWVALRRRAEFQPGQDVLVLGATGNAGRLAVQIAKLLGAGRVVAAGRDEARLSAVGASETVPLDRVAEAADVDVVLDYVWGEPTAAAMAAVVTHRADRGKPLTWIEIGSVAGPTAAIPSAALRAARLRIIGSGQGSVTPRDIIAELPSLAEEITRGTFEINARPVALSDVEQAWAESTSTTERLVLTP
ncbi:NADPH:quinone reductase [Amycolatopsis sacchari]|uniref:NADPH:quinone reductase n=1 Tax=Amycolatopsis sacchari TaxID=115433 RepID=A0A1I3QBT0_9PSEU|nr:zinc-binding alcohol dehydrogenase family protein [Amycolatopsis sacchari]SFJ31358.1 NADPH:quinone reductase [Amycolatopsis sacchari]